jgi:NADH:ubiquinone oxidoreductase subunit 3 (subunit A)
MEYLNLLNSIVLSLCISATVLGIPYAIVRKLTDKEKSSTYECGFHPFQSSRGKFHVHFYLVAILFLVFDLEIILLFPWSSGQLKYSFYCTLAAYTFLALLISIYAYEWKKGGMDWNNFPARTPFFSGLLWELLVSCGILKEVPPDLPFEEWVELTTHNYFVIWLLSIFAFWAVVRAVSNWEDLKHDLKLIHHNIKYIYRIVMDKLKSFFSKGGNDK